MRKHKHNLLQDRSDLRVPTGPIRITNAAWSEVPDGKGGTRIIVRGVLTLPSMGALGLAFYQRGQEGQAHINEIKKGFRTNAGVPDIYLGMRGGSYSEPTPGNVLLHNPVYNVDGQQRIAAALQLIEEGFAPNLGMTCYFNTDEAWEEDMFQVLNLKRKAVKTDVLIRNMQGWNEGVALIMALTKDSTSVLYENISWDGKQLRTKLFKASVIVDTVASLHRRVMRQRPSGSSITNAENLASLVEKIGRAQTRANIKTFFSVLEECFNLRHIQYGDKNPQIQKGFLQALARVFATHSDFWENEWSLVVSDDWRKKLRGFDVLNLNVISLTSSLGDSNQVELAKRIVTHLNTKRKRKLTNFDKPLLYSPQEELLEMAAAC